MSTLRPLLVAAGLLIAGLVWYGQKNQTTTTASAPVVSPADRTAPPSGELGGSAHDLRVLDERAEPEFDQGRGMRIKGRIRNDSQTTYRSVTVRYQMLNRKGEVLGTAIDNLTSGLAPGETWKFDAIGSAPEMPYTFKLDELVGR